MNEMSVDIDDFLCCTLSLPAHTDAEDKPKSSWCTRHLHVPELLVLDISTSGYIKFNSIVILFSF